MNIYLSMSVKEILHTYIKHIDDVINPKSTHRTSTDIKLKYNIILSVPLAFSSELNRYLYKLIMCTLNVQDTLIRTI